MPRPSLPLAALALCLGACAHPPLLDDPAAPHPRVAPAAPSLALKRFPGEGVWHLTDDQGHVVLLDVWATWCEPCREALPLYDDLHKEFAAQGVKVYAINVDADPKLITPFLNEVKVGLPVLLDPEASVVESTLKVKMMPTSFVLDRAGRVRHVHEGFDESLLSSTLEEVKALLAEPEADR